MLTIHCKRCRTVWYKNGKGKCPRCNESIGEMQIRLCLEHYNIPYMREVHTGYKKTRYDFVIMDMYNRYCVIEFDGKQHFEYVKYFHKSMKKFHKYLIKENNKMNHALQSGLRVLRISYKSMKYIEQAIVYLMQSNQQVIIV